MKEERSYFELVNGGYDMGLCYFSNYDFDMKTATRPCIHFSQLCHSVHRIVEIEIGNNCKIQSYGWYPFR